VARDILSKARIPYHAEQMVEVLVSIRIRRGGEEEQFLTWSTSVSDPHINTRIKVQHLVVSRPSSPTLLKSLVV
jgi:hypothetical protein